MARIYVGGLPGSGKSKAGQYVVNTDPRVKVVVSSDLFMEFLGVTDRTKLKDVPKDEMKEMKRTKLVEFIKANPNLIMDGHYNLTDEMVSLFDSFVFINVDPEKLLEFRHNDSERGERLKDSEVIASERDKYLSKLSSAEDKYGIKIVHIKNDGSIADLGEKLLAAYRIADIESETKNEFQEGKLNRR